MSTANVLIAAIKLKGGMPDDNYYTDDNMLTILNDEMKLTINPLVMKLQEEYFLENKTYTITSGGTYRLPKRCLGNKLRDVKLIDSNGAYTDLERLFEEDRSSNKRGYYISRNTITLSSDITTGSLKITYFMSPSALVLTSSVATVQSIDSATQVTVSSLPSTISVSSPVDFIQANGPYDLLDKDVTISSISGTILTFSSLPDDLAVGDYICLAEQSPVPLIPEDLHPVLVQAALCVCLSSKKDKSVELELQKLEQMKQTISEMLDPRVESNDVKFHGQGLLSKMIRR